MSMAKQKRSRQAVTAEALGAIHELGPTAGLHALGAHLRAAGGEARARQIMSALPEALEVTAAEAPVRNRPYVLGVDTQRDRESADNSWARALRKDFGPDGSGELPLIGCARLMGIHVAIADRRLADRWNAIDLLGIDRIHRLPVVIEMTMGSLTLLDALVNAVAEAVALRKAWSGRLREDWGRAVKKVGFGEPDLPVHLNRVTVIVAAPDPFWRSLEEVQQPDCGRMSTEALQTVHAFIYALECQGFDSYFASLRERRVGGEVDGIDVALHLLPRLAAPAGRPTM